jgi:RimJ/RimL family protein N-acetyltransferase
VHTKTNTLAAIVWFGPKPLGRKSLKHLTEKELKEDESKVDSENWHTISYRCYPIFRGQGLMKYFVNFVMNIYLKKFPQIKIWAGINIKNKASEALARRLGFRIVEESSDPENNWLVMIKD